jgi:hypothetical protein
MNNMPVRTSFVRVQDESTPDYFTVSSSSRRPIFASSEVKESTSTGERFPVQQSAEVSQISFQTSNFNDEKSTFLFRPMVLDCIAQAEKNAREKITLQYVNELRILIQKDEFFDGEVSRSEQYMIEAYEHGQLDYIADAMMTIYSSSLDDAHMLEGILTMISCVPYEAIEPKGQIMAMGLLTNKELVVRDKAIQCFERWNSKKGLGYLKNIVCGPSWLQKYVEKVIMYIERDGLE